MAFIKVLGPEEAEGELRRQYDAAKKRAGRISNIVSIQGHNPKVLRSSMALYRDMMYGPSPLSRAQREMVAVVVSKANKCHY
ncbi:MAG: carboxymuconolactone decarboxylase family protein [candidate division Zixibacteria bacterium]